MNDPQPIVPSDEAIAPPWGSVRDRRLRVLLLGNGARAHVHAESDRLRGVIEKHSEIVLCERGIRTFEPATRNTLDLGGMAVAQLESHLPVIVDPSHATGHKDLVAPMARAALAGGADGVMVDVHPNPGEALCDGPQALRPEELLELARDLQALAAVLGRRFG